MLSVIWSWKVIEYIISFSQTLPYYVWCFFAVELLTSDIIFVIVLLLWCFHHMDDHDFFHYTLMLLKSNDSWQFIVHTWGRCILWWRYQIKSFLLDHFLPAENNNLPPFPVTTFWWVPSEFLSHPWMLNDDEDTWAGEGCSTIASFIFNENNMMIFNTGTLSPLSCPTQKIMCISWCTWLKRECSKTLLFML